MASFVGPWAYSRDRMLMEYRMIVIIDVNPDQDLSPCVPVEGVCPGGVASSVTWSPTSDYSTDQKPCPLPSTGKHIVLYQGRIKRHLTIIAKTKATDRIYTICYVRNVFFVLFSSEFH